MQILPIDSILNILVSIGKIKDEIHVRIRELPIVDTLRDLRQNHLNQHEHVASISSIYDIIVTFLTHRLVRVHGVLWSVWRLHFFSNPLPLYQVVTRRSVVFPQLKVVHFRCLSCDVNLGPFRQNNTTEVPSI